MSVSYENIPHALWDLWRTDDQLQASIAATGDEQSNLFFRFGIEHLPYARICSLPSSYVVVNDLGERGRLRGSGGYRNGQWSFRIGIYGGSEHLAGKLGRRYLERLQTSLHGCQTKLGSVCDVLISDQSGPIPIVERWRHQFTIQTSTNNPRRG